MSCMVVNTSQFLTVISLAAPATTKTTHTDNNSSGSEGLNRFTCSQMCFFCVCVSAGARGAVFRWLPGRGRGASLGKSTQTLKKTMKHQNSWVYIYFFILFYFVPSHWFIDWSLRSCPRTCIQYIYHPLHCAVHLKGSRSFNTRSKLIWRSPILPPFFTFFFFQPGMSEEQPGVIHTNSC